MSIDWIAIKSQLAPGLSPVNILIAAVLLLISWPLALLMAAYIFKGSAIGLDLRYPSTYTPAILKLFDHAKSLFARIKSGAAPAVSAGSQQPSASGGKPAMPDTDFEQWRSEETAKLKRERAALEREKMLFEASKKAFEEKSQ